MFARGQNVGEWIEMQPRARQALPGAARAATVRFTAHRALTRAGTVVGRRVVGSRIVGRFGAAGAGGTGADAAGAGGNSVAAAVLYRAVPLMPVARPAFSLRLQPPSSSPPVEMARTAETSSVRSTDIGSASWPKKFGSGNAVAADGAAHNTTIRRTPGNKKSPRENPEARVARNRGCRAFATRLPLIEV